MSEGARTTLAARMRRAAVGVAALSVLVASVAFYAVWSMHALASRTDELGRQVSALAQGLSAGGPLGTTVDSGLRGRLLRVQAALIGARLIVVDRRGKVTFSTFERGTGPATLDMRVFSEADERGVRLAVRDVGSGEMLLLVAAPVDGGGYLVGAQTVQDVRLSLIHI
ncbi:MAG: hypothetical protein N3B11_05905, partial [Coriobacteriia bacterium]|nr:hypothetical protein [Coriobacteriia bacterium]